jgi:uncharacterized membrane protein YdjX (TVP38/TMEM64 family)
MQTSAPSPPRRRSSLSLRGWMRLLVGLVVLGVGGWAWYTGALSGLTLEGVRTWVADAGPWGPLAYVIAFAALQPFGVSAHMFLVVAGLAWPPAIALPIGYIGMMSAALSAFGLARWMGKETIQARMPGWLEKWDARLEQGGLKTVILVRLLFFTAFPVQLMLAVSKVRFRDYVLGTAIGNLPVLVIIVVFADRLASWMGS